MYTRLSFTVNDMDEIQSDLSASIQVVSGECIFSCNEVLKAVDKLELHKADEGKGLSSDYLKKAGRDLYVHVILLLSGILIHGCVPDDLSVCTVISIPKGKNSNVTESTNNRGIALISILEQNL